MSKKCINCGAELPDQAAFCPSCETAQVEKTAAAPPRPWRRRAMYGACILAAALAVAGGIFLAGRPDSTPAPTAAAMPTSTPAPTPEPYRPQTFDEGGAVLHYGDYTILAVFEKTELEGDGPTGHMEMFMPVGRAFTAIDQLYVRIDGEERDVTGEFLALVERAQMTTTPLDGRQAMSFTHPGPLADCPDAAFVSTIGAYDACGTNALLWTVYMKNGDVLQLHQTVEVTIQPTVTYTAKDAPMDTVEDLQALLERVSREVTDEDTVVVFSLPPVTYDGTLVMEDRSVDLRGSVDQATGARTTFTGGVRVCTQSPQLAFIEGIDFVGSGGVGLEATWSAEVENCTFTGWDTGILSHEKAWVGLYRCAFRSNGVGYEMDFYTAYYTNLVFYGCEFRDNGVGMKFDRVPGSGIFTFPDTVFSGNGTDVINLTDRYGVDLSGAIFE